MAAVRKLSVEARAERSTTGTARGDGIPPSKPTLAASLVTPSPDTFRAVSHAEYRRWRIFDKAYGYLDRALRMDPHDSLTHEAFARLWRDNGLPNVALGDAYRAVFYYRRVGAILRNTLGTILQAMGRHDEASRSTRAVT
jgi:tetratricopeptide (TPR) repeat protein